MQKTLKKNRADLFLTLLLFLFLFLAIGKIKLVSEGMEKGLALCGGTLIPTLFPFLILTDLLLSVESAQRFLRLLSRPFASLLRLSPAGGSVFLLGNLFGFPMGAKATAKYYQMGALDREEAERLLLFSGNPSPFFIIGSVGAGMLSSAKLGLFLYLLQFTLSFLCGCFLGFFSPRNKKKNEIAPILSKEQISFSATVRGAVKQTLFICGYVLFFSALSALLLPFIKSTYFSCLLASFLEIGTASSLAAASAGRFSLPFCAFSASFSGVSVYFQTKDCISDTDLQIRDYLPIKLLCASFAFFAAWLFPH